MIFFILNLFLPRWFHTFSTYFFFKKNSIFINMWWYFFQKKSIPLLSRKTTQLTFLLWFHRRWAMWRFPARPRKTWRRSRAHQRSPLVEVEAKAGLGLRPGFTRFTEKSPGQSSRVPTKGRFFPPKKRGEGKMVFGWFWLVLILFNLNLLYKNGADSEQWYFLGLMIFFSWMWLFTLNYTTDQYPPPRMLTYTNCWRSSR